MVRWSLLALTSIAGCVAETGELSAVPWHLAEVPGPGDALRAWDGPLGPLCDADRVELRGVPLASVQAECSVMDSRVAGCFLAALPTSTAIYAVDAADPPARIAAHELTHWLFFCSDRIDRERFDGAEHDHPAFQATLDAIKNTLRPRQSTVL